MSEPAGPPSKPAIPESDSVKKRFLRYIRRQQHPAHSICFAVPAEASSSLESLGAQAAQLQAVALESAAAVTSSALEAVPEPLLEALKVSGTEHLSFSSPL